ncbi:DUF2550 domain-containing protein [Pseudonocardia bannensis]|uniref:DUF2550 domain-containing protein n=1 Tax=Pseudonocardia bannensis TaxID=630973 RepID=UPI0028A5B6B7|nr:DUF2550 domain-containing protein [Pseudonocardia bannensis]
MTVVVGLLLLFGCLLLGWFAVRRVRLMRGGGVDVCLRRRSGICRESRESRDSAAGWHFGVGRYRGEQLAWHRLTSFRLGPTVSIDRNELEIVDRREPTGPESYALPPAAVVLRCRHPQGADLELAMSPGVLTGFLSWLEATPPGRSTGYRQAS